MSEYGDLRQIELPNGAAIYYRDKDHSYWQDIKERRDGTWGGTGRVPGISTATKPLDYRPDNLMRWAAKTNLEGVALLAAEARCLDEADSILGALNCFESAETLWRELELRDLTYEDLRERRATEGTNIHEKVLYALATGRRVPSLAKLSTAERGFGQAMLKAWRDLDPDPLQAEQVVYSQINRFAGRFDLRANISAETIRKLAAKQKVPESWATGLNETWLLDAKTSGYISIAAHAQIAGYELAADECGFGTSDRQVILQLAEDGTYQLIGSVATGADFLAGLDAYERAKRLTSDAGKDRREREKVREVLAA